MKRFVATCVLVCLLCANTPFFILAHASDVSGDIESVSVVGVDSSSEDDSIDTLADEGA